MQRRKVLLPDPEGPMRQRTSPGLTTRSIPRSTSRRPNDLWTWVARTIGSLMGGQPRSVGHGRNRLDPDVEEGLADPLDGGRGKGPSRPPRVVALDVVLPDGEQRGEEEVPQARHQQERDDLVVGVGDVRCLLYTSPSPRDGLLS